MNIPKDRKEPEGSVTIMIVDKVRPEKTQAYEEWLKGIHDDMETATGFLDVTVIKPGDSGSTEYAILIKFDNHQNLLAWRQSFNQQGWSSKYSDLIQSETMQESSGLDIWFTRPDKPGTAKPAYWKQVVLGVITVYPMILILNVVLSPITKNLPFNISLFISVVALSALLTYPIMPYATRLLGNWLNPKN